MKHLNDKYRNNTFAMPIMAGLLALTMTAAEADIVAAAWTHSVTVRSDGTVWVWGSNSNSNNQGTLLGIGGNPLNIEKSRSKSTACRALLRYPRTPRIPWR
ncbi:RCC1-like domain-containing protein [Candidatus Methylobacter oryzae]|uniref:RCC1-like domain-containing protein n=1 Tax=Candidatus Methylobacter oryzae TaxID=2497749 RepID=UPI0013875CDE|nr:RCC1 domain-containing protein [Candidatus Methylobacter oryzae]